MDDGVSMAGERVRVGRRSFLGAIGATGLALAGAGCWSGNDDDAGEAPAAGVPAAARRPEGAAAATPLPRSRHAAVLLDSGLVLLVGGFGLAGSLASCQLLDPDSGDWYDAAPLSIARGQLSGSRLDDGKVLCLGGHTGGYAVAVASVFDPDADRWEPVAPLASPRADHATIPVGDGRFLVTGGTAGTPLVRHEIYELR